MNPKIAIISAVYGQSDPIKPTFPQNGDVEFLMVTDDAGLAAGVVDPMGWKIIYEPRNDMAPVRAAKIPKLFPWRYTDRNFSVWIDGSMRLRSAFFANQMIQSGNPIGMFPHPDRDCVFDEARETLGMQRYSSQHALIAEQMAEYAHHPHHHGLWATGIVSRRHTPDVVSFSEQWETEINRYSYQDQISLPIVARANQLWPDSIKYGDIWKSNFHEFVPSGRHK